MAVVIKTEYPASWYCQPGDGKFIRIYLSGALALQAVAIISLAMLAQQSARGSITDTRKFVVPLFLFK